MMRPKPKGKKKVAPVRRRAPQPKPEGQKQGQIQNVNVYTQAPARRRAPQRPRVQANPMFQTFYIPSKEQQLTLTAPKQSELNLSQTVSGTVDSIVSQSRPQAIEDKRQPALEDKRESRKSEFIRGRSASKTPKVTLPRGRPKGSKSGTKLQFEQQRQEIESLKKQIEDTFPILNFDDEPKKFRIGGKVM